MSKYIEQIPLGKIKRIAILRGNGRLAAQVKKDTGADYVMNAGFYGSDGKPTHHLKADGNVFARAPWGCWGLSWDTGPDIRMEGLPADGRVNYIAGVELLSPMVSEIGLQYDHKGELGGIRGRSAMALTADNLILYCSGDGTKDASTLERVQEELRQLASTAAIYVDGGGSSQCDFGGGKTIYSSRPVYSFVCVWLDKKEEDKPVATKYKVCLDPGHGVETAGKRSPDGTYFEHEFNLDMANRLKALLLRHGIEVLLTRSTEKDVTLERRVNISNSWGPDLFVSIHSNASGDGKSWTSPDGYGIYTSAAGATAKRNIAANKILSRAKEAGIKIWGGGLFHELWYVCKNAIAPAVLIEHGFHTNKAETDLLKSDTHRQKLAEVDCKGILDYLGVAWQDDKPTPLPWYDGAQKWAIKAGISDGKRPEENITRAEVWAMLQSMSK